MTYGQYRAMQQAILIWHYQRRLEQHYGLLTAGSVFGNSPAVIGSPAWTARQLGVR